MSVQAIAWVLDHCPVRGTDRLVLLSLANHADPTGANAWPSLPTIAREAGGPEDPLDRRTVQRSLHRLIDAGHVSVRRQAGGLAGTETRYRPNLYTLSMRPWPRGGAGTAPDVGSGAARETVRGGADAARTVLDPSSNPPTPLDAASDDRIGPCPECHDHGMVIGPDDLARRCPRCFPPPEPLAPIEPRPRRDLQ